MTRRPRVLLLPCPTTGGTLGTVGYMLAIAEALRDHAEILAHCTGYCAAYMAKHGFAVSQGPEPIPMKGTVIDIRDLLDAIEWMGLAEPDYLDRAVQSELDVIESFRPDVVLSDFCLSAPISTAVKGVPLVSLAQWPTHPRFPDPPSRPGYLADQVNQVIARYGLAPIQDVRELCYLRSSAGIATTIPELEPQLLPIPGMHFIGALVHSARNPLATCAWRTDKHKVFVYLSVSALPPRVYIPILHQAFPPDQFEVICSLGAGYDPAEFGPAPEGVTVVEWAPMEDLLREAELVIYHGGQGTGMAAALAGVPSIALPGQHFERQYNAEQLQAAGVGIWARTEDFRPSRLRRWFFELQQPHVRTRLAEIAEQAKVLGGASAAAQILLDTAAVSTNAVPEKALTGGKNR